MLENLKCIVTGASSGIGKATCEALTKNGAKVIGVGRNTQSLQELKDNNMIIEFIEADITQDGACETIVKTAIEHFEGTLTTVINAAGILQGGPMGNVDMENYNNNMNTNCKAPFEIMMHAIPYLRQQQKYHPSIVNVSSVNGKQSFPGCVSYCMSKAAVDQLTRCASVDLAKDGIRVNSVNPGVIKTNIHMTSGMSQEAYNKFLKRSIEVTHPIAQSLNRIGEPNEVADLIVFLVSDKAKFITGECIAIDGGRQNLGAR